MSTIAEILDRLSGVAVLRERVADTSRNVDKSLNWLLDHEKRLIRMESIAGAGTMPAPAAHPAHKAPRLPRGK